MLEQFKELVAVCSQRRPKHGKPRKPFYFVSTKNLHARKWRRRLGQDVKPWQFPEALRPELDFRLHEFTDAQASGNWDQVSGLLGRYRRGAGFSSDGSNASLHRCTTGSLPEPEQNSATPASPKQQHHS
jgi:hypothetical protein